MYSISTVHEKVLVAATESMLISLGGHFMIHCCPSTARHHAVSAHRHGDYRSRYLCMCYSHHVQTD